ncbi:serine-tRNA ligase [Allomyces macrogynus ATCC 38327]|uniref:serine--tRNA ligase n=1 Tax=Allomyces macrogynus (strain ATCC 38327) TaxID=578462 RepID=A0A0L0SYK1_ALLM3|nr:serine-tRNA ligase [Allomyces macrogynus ATCC 38327]|eukprot:KNE67576.1 serine-tRNA ligase [Allomyces macrogynus ATCC 38327]
MTIDINLLRTDKGGNPALVRESERKRGNDPKRVDQVIALDEEWKKITFQLDRKNKDLNAVKKEIGTRMKAKKDASDLLEQKKAIEAEQAQLADAKKAAEDALNEALGALGNLVHDSVIDSKNEDNNEIVRTWFKDGKTPVKDALLSHHEVLARLAGYDPERGVKVAGHRGYFLTDVGVDLILGLVQYGLAFLKKKGHKKLMTPYFMNKDIMAKTAQLSQFDEELYKVSGDAGDDKYLIATSEQPISAFHAGEWIPEAQLPIKYAGFSSCFRKEAGAHGKDTWGIFRVHQFEKVEQFVLCDPDKSWEMLEEMIGNSEEFYQSLGLSYRVVSIVSGALNNAAAKKYDLEAWFPFQGEYKELVSCSNCTDYQSRNLEIRCGTKKLGQTEKKYVHCLNATLTAAERTLCCILENWQTEDGFRVPPPLVPYVGEEFIPYVVELKGKGKAKAPVAPAPTKAAAAPAKAAAPAPATKAATPAPAPAAAKGKDLSKQVEAKLKM